MSDNRIVKSAYCGPPVDDALIAELREMAKAGTTVSHIVDTIENKVPYAKDSCMWSILYLVKAFHIGIKEAKDLGAWTRYHSPGHGYTDEEINAELMPLIIKSQPSWDEDTR